MNMDQVREIVALDKELDDLKAKVESVKTRMDELRYMLIPQFLAENCQNIRVDGRLLSITEDVYPRLAAARPVVAQALKKADLGDLVKEDFNLNRLKAYVREVKDEVELACKRNGTLLDEETMSAGLPEPLRPVIQIGFVHTLKVLSGKG